MPELWPFLGEFLSWRTAGLWLSLAVAVQWCRPLPVAGPGVPAAPATTRTLPAPVDSVPRLIAQLLDTTRAGSRRAADASLGLQAPDEVRAFYGRACRPAWTRPAGSLTPTAAAALAVLARAPEHGLRPADYGWPRLQALRDSLARPTNMALRPRQQARLEVYLSDAVLRFMRDLSRGRLRPYTISARERAAGAAGQPVPALRAALAHGTVPAAMLAGQPRHRAYRQLQQALAWWLAQPAPPADSAARHEARYQQAAVNLERWRWDALPAADTEYVLINIPSYELHLVSGDSVRWRHRVIVGQPRTPTPTLSSHLTHFTLAPDWHVPASIATQEILPHLRRGDTGYLTRNNFALYDSNGQLVDPASVAWAQVSAGRFAYTVRQAAGCDNALGNIVFRFANPYAVYLHDTPARQLFERPGRALSHGCVRLAEPLALADYLLRREGRQVTLPSEAECARQPTPRTVRLHRPLPLHIRYATCTAERGQLRFWPDVYHRDEVIRRGLFGPSAL